MARRLAKLSEEEIKTAFFYPSDLVNTKTTIPLRVGEERWICPPLFTSPSDSCIITGKEFAASPPLTSRTFARIANARLTQYDGHCFAPKISVDPSFVPSRNRI